MPSGNWLDPAWEAQAHEWIHDRLRALGMPPSGPVERLRVRPWSVHLRVPAGAGPVWFKANIAASAYEAGLVAGLAAWAPGSVVTPLAVDVERGWMLNPDGGRTMRDASDLARWAPMLTAYAQLQRDVTAYAPEMTALGVPDQRTELMPGQLAGLLDDPGVREDLGTERREAIAAFTPTYASWCAELATDGIPSTVQHDDLHDGNVFLAGDGYRFFDWGDAAVAHPFCSLRVALRVAAHQFKLAPDAPELDRLRDAYLEPWSADLDRKSLLRSAALATRVAVVGRSLSWQRALSGAEVPIDPDFEMAVAETLTEITDAG